MGLKIMVMVCFVGIKEESFRAGTAVLPKFFLENVGLESFEVLRRSGGKKVGVSDMPRVMVESFLRDYLEIEFVVGRELKVCSGYFVGLMEEKNNKINNVHDQQVLEDEKKIASSSIIIGISSFNKSLDHPLFSLCKVPKTSTFSIYISIYLYLSNIQHMNIDNSRKPDLTYFL